MSRDIEKCLAQLKAFFEETPREELDKIYDELKEWEDVGPTYEDYVKFLSQSLNVNGEQVDSKHHYIGKRVLAGGELNGVYGTIVGVEEFFDEDFDCTKVIIHIKDEADGSIVRCYKDDVVELIPQIQYITKELD